MDQSMDIHDRHARKRPLAQATFPQVPKRGRHAVESGPSGRNSSDQSCDVPPATWPLTEAYSQRDLLKYIKPRGRLKASASRSHLRFHKCAHNSVARACGQANAQPSSTSYHTSMRQEAVVSDPFGGQISLHDSLRLVGIEAPNFSERVCVTSRGACSEKPRHSPVGPPRDDFIRHSTDSHNVDSSWSNRDASHLSFMQAREEHNECRESAVQSQSVSTCSDRKRSLPQAALKETT